jgi:hypothetical protein
MKLISNYILFAAVWALSLPAWSDAIMQNLAANAATIAQYYIDDEGVRVELQIGEESIKEFRNLLPDEIYQGLGFGSSPLAERLQTFFSEQFSVASNGAVLPGYLTAIGPSRGILRDTISGTPLPVQEAAPDVIRATLQFPFSEEAPPDQLDFIIGIAGNIGFVAYHNGVAVNDFRYLAPGYTLELDWLDPWYSVFNPRNITRQYSAPMSGFIYVEDFEVRKEIILRPKDLQRWVDLGLEGKTVIPVEIQAAIKEKVGAFLAVHQALTIDGEPAQGILESVNFLERTLTSSRVIDPAEELDLDSAIIGTIFVYPRRGLPQSVVMDWDLWDERIQRIPVSSVDQAGALPTFLDPDWRKLVWNNYLKDPIVPSFATVESPVDSWRILLNKLTPLVFALTFAALLWLLIGLMRRRTVAIPAGLAVLCATASVAAMQLGASNQPDQARANAIVGDLLHNIYRAFDFGEESEIYDVLARSVTGDLLTDVFLETKHSLVLANQGGAQAKVKDVELESVTLKPNGNEGQFKVETDWTVHGAVGHWGHVHQRSNRYQALLTVVVDEDQWKLQEMTVLQEERL